MAKSNTLVEETVVARNIIWTISQQGKLLLVIMSRCWVHFSFGSIKSKFSQIPEIFLVLNKSHQEENEALKTFRRVLCHKAWLNSSQCLWNWKRVHTTRKVFWTLSGDAPISIVQTGPSIQTCGLYRV